MWVFVEKLTARLDFFLQPYDYNTLKQSEMTQSDADGAVTMEFSVDLTKVNKELI